MISHLYDRFKTKCNDENDEFIFLQSKANKLFSQKCKWPSKKVRMINYVYSQIKKNREEF